MTSTFLVSGSHHAFRDLRPRDRHYLKPVVYAGCLAGEGKTGTASATVYPCLARLLSCVRAVASCRAPVVVNLAPHPQAQARRVARCCRRGRRICHCAVAFDQRVRFTLRAVIQAILADRRRAARRRDGPSARREQLGLKACRAAACRRWV